MNRLTYVLESKGLLNSYQSGFRKGRSTIDSLICLENDIRKALVNKEVVVGVCFDVEKAYDMMWREGLLIKLDKFGINGRLYNWIIHFLMDRTIQIRVGKSYSKKYSTENGTPHGSVSSPILFNIMMSDVFDKIQPENRNI